MSEDILEQNTRSGYR